MDATLLTQIETIIIAATPAITSIVAMIVGFIRLIKQFKENKNETLEKLKAVVDDDKEMKAQLVAINEENIKLKKTINELLTKITKIKHKGE